MRCMMRPAQASTAARTGPTKAAWLGQLERPRQTIATKTRILKTTVSRRAKKTN